MKAIKCSVYRFCPGKHFIAPNLSTKANWRSGAGMQGTQCALGGEGRVEARSPLGLREHNTDHMKHGLKVWLF